MMDKFKNLLKLYAALSIKICSFPTLAYHFPSREYNEFVSILKMPDAPKLEIQPSKIQDIIMVSAATAFAALYGISTTEFISQLDGDTKEKILEHPRIPFVKSKEVMLNFWKEDNDGRLDNECDNIFDPNLFKEFIQTEDYMTAPSFFVRLLFTFRYYVEDGYINENGFYFDESHYEKDTFDTLPNINFLRRIVSEYSRPSISIVLLVVNNYKNFDFDLL